MKVEVRITKTFNKRAKALLKKYPSLLNELQGLESELVQNPHLGQPLGNDSYKIRLSIQSKGKGKSGGARVITHLKSEIVGTLEMGPAGEITIYLLTIYDKFETATISNKELKELIKKRN
jgi:mRNA-degrading endonuclease RelE of RelBE toxin-antitoxin system